MSLEVRIMRSVTSFFNFTLYKKNMKRFWPVWGLYLTIWLFILPISLIMREYNVERFAAERILGYVINAGLPMALIFSLLGAMAVWSYLFNNRSACLIHQLPIRREGLFLTNYLSGLSFMLLPNVAVFILTLLAEMLVYLPDVINLLSWLLAVSLMEIFFFSFATVCAMFTGHLLALPAFYAILNGLIWGISILTQAVMEKFVFGFAGIAGADTVIKYLTPVYALVGDVDAVEVDAVQGLYRLTGWGTLLIYFAVGLILAGVGLVVYRRRHMEQAGDMVTVKWVRPVFRYGVGFCSALAFGMFIFEMFSDSLPDTAWALMIVMLVCGAAGYFIACMLLEKSFRVFYRWKGCSVLLAVLVLLTCAVELDLFGYERYVPKQDGVSSVELILTNTRPFDSANNVSIEFDDPQVIRGVLAVHQAIVEEKNGSDVWSKNEVMHSGYSVQTHGRSGFYVSYTLADGRKITRDYLSRAAVAAEDLSDPDSLTAKLDALINMPQVVEQGYDLSDLDVTDIGQISVTTLTVKEEGYSIMEEVAVANSPEIYEKVMQAVWKDLEQGNFRRYLMDDQERMTNCFVNDLMIQVPRYGSFDPWDGDADEKVPSFGQAEYYTVGLQTGAVHTLAALKEAGVLTGTVHLLTHAQQEAAEGKWNGDWDGLTNADLDDYAWDVMGK